MNLKHADEGLGEVFEVGCGDVDGVPFWAALFHVLFVVGDGCGEDGVPAVAVGVGFEEEGIGGLCFAPVEEDECGLEAGSEDLFPLLEVVDVFAGDPVVKLVSRTAGVFASFDVDEEIGSVGGVDDEVEVFEFDPAAQ